MLAILLALQSAPQDSTRPEFSVTIPRLEGEARIDGQLDEPVWQEAARLTGFHQYQPVDSRPAEEETEVLVWYAPNAIYFGIMAHDREPGGSGPRWPTGTTSTPTTASPSTSTPSTTGAGRSSSPSTRLASRKTGSAARAGLPPGRCRAGPPTRTPTTSGNPKGSVTDSGYVVEIRIPFKSLRYPGNGAAALGPQHPAAHSAHRLRRHLDRHPAGQRELPAAGRDESTACTISSAGSPPSCSPSSRRRPTGSAPRTGFEPRGLRSERRRQSAARAGQQSLARRHLQSRFQPDRVRREPGDGQRAVRAVLSGEATILPRGNRAVRDAQPAGLYPADRESDRRREGHREVRPLQSGSSDRPG